MTYEELEPYYDRFERTTGVSGKAGNLKGQIRAGGNRFEGPREREFPLPPLQPSYATDLFMEGDREPRLSPVSASRIERVSAVYESRRREARRVPVLRTLRTFRLRVEREGESTHHGNPDRDAQSELRTTHARVGHEGAARFERDESDRCSLHRCGDGTGIRAAGGSRHSVRLRDQQRPSVAAVGHRAALRSCQSDRSRRQELLLPGGRRGRDAFLRRSLLQSFHRQRERSARSSTISIPIRTSTAAATGSSAAPRSAWAHQGAGRSTTVLSLTARRAGVLSGRRRLPAGTSMRWASAAPRAICRTATTTTISIRSYRNPFGQPLLRLTYNFVENDFKVAAFAAEKTARNCQSSWPHGPQCTGRTAR